MFQNQDYTYSEFQTEKYYQLPQFLFTVPRYRKLSDGAKLAYALLKDRFKYSIRNHWVDDNGSIYFIYTNEQLENILNWGNKKVVRIKKELIQAQLLRQERLGLNQPNRLYLQKPIINACEIYNKKSAESLDNSGSVKTTLQRSDTQNTILEPKSISQSSKKVPSTLDNSGSVKTTHYQEKEYIDTNKIHIDTQNKKQMFSSNNYSKQEITNQNQQLLKSAPDFFTKTDNKADMILNEEGLNWLSIWCRTPQQMKEVIGIILKAKHGVLDYIAEQVGKDKASDLDLYMAELATNNPEENRQIKYQLTLTLKKVLNSIRSGEEANKPVKNQTGYMYKAFYNFYAKYFDKLLQSNAKAE